MIFKNVAANNNLNVTNIYFCEGDKAPSDFGVWEESSEQELKCHKHSEHIFTQAGVRFYGRV